jgi:hypothetical protein
MVAEEEIMKTWKQPYSRTRFQRYLDTKNDHSDYEQLEENNGEPSLARAHRRIKQALRARRDRRSSGYDPIFDTERIEFHVNDVALLQARLELAHWLERFDLALGPPVSEQRFNRKTGKFEDMGNPDDFGD